MSLPVDLTVNTSYPSFTKSFAPDTIALGSRIYIESIFASSRSYFSQKRNSGARPLSGPSLRHLYGLRDLQVRLIE